MATQISLGSLYSNIWTAFHEIISGNVADPNSRNKRWIYGCVDEKTETLTKDGWRKYDELKEGDLLLTFNIKKKLGEWKPIKKLNQYKVTNEEMINVEGRRISMLLTKNHRCVVAKRPSYKYSKRHWKVIDAKKLLSESGLEVLNRVIINDYPNETLDDDFIKLLGWIITEASINKRGGLTIYQSSTNELYVNEIRELIKSCGFKFTERVKDRRGKPINILKGREIYSNGLEHGFYIYRKHLKKIMKYIPNKRLTFNLINLLSKKQALLLLDSLIKADGWIDGKRIGFVQKSEITIDAYQYLLIYCGFIGNKYKSNNGIFRIKTLNTTNISLEVNHKTMATTENYSGIVWCPTIDNGTWMARRNGIPFITGNSMPNIDARNFNGFPIIIINNPTITDSRLTMGSTATYDVDGDIAIDVYADYSAHTAQIMDNMRRVIKSSTSWNGSGTTYAGLKNIDFGTSDNSPAPIGKKIVHVSTLPISFKVSH